LVGGVGGWGWVGWELEPITKSYWGIERNKLIPNDGAKKGV